MFKKCTKCSNSLDENLTCDKCEAVHELCPWCKTLVLDTREKCPACKKNLYVSPLARIGWKIHKISIVVYIIAGIAIGYSQYWENRNLLEATIFGVLTFVIFFGVFNGMVFFLLKMGSSGGGGEGEDMACFLEMDE